MSERDHSLIAEFNARRCENAFAALVRQHVNLVFATALRQVGDHGTAEEITQNVFVALAESAGKLGSHPTIAGWLYQTTLNKSRERLRSDLRRRRREQVAVKLELAGAEGDSVWASLVPLLDEALLELREADRLAVMLHFMEGRTFCEVGSALGIGEDAARKRANRCLDQLTNFSRRHGFNVPALTAGKPLFALSSPAAPAGLAASATTAGLAAAHSAASTSTLTLIKGALKIMAWTKTTLAVGVLVVAGVATTLIIRHHENQNSYAPGNQPSKSADEEKAIAISKMNDAKQLVTGMLMYAHDHQTQSPTSFDQMAAYFKNDPNARNNMDQFEIVYQGSLDKIADPNSTIVVMEKKPWSTSDGTLAKTYGFADGHTAIRVAPFEPFERTHMILPPNP